VYVIENVGMLLVTNLADHNLTASDKSWAWRPGNEATRAAVPVACQPYRN